MIGVRSAALSAANNAALDDWPDCIRSRKNAIFAKCAKFCVLATACCAARRRWTPIGYRDQFAWVAPCYLARAAFGTLTPLAFAAVGNARWFGDGSL